MKKRLDNAEKVKQAGPVKAKQRFNLADPVAMQNLLTKEWDLHGTIAEVLSPRKCKVQFETGYRYEKMTSTYNHPPIAKTKQ